VPAEPNLLERIALKWCSGAAVALPAVPAVMKTPEPAVAEYAMQYIAVRAWGIPAVLAGFVAIGTYRGFKVRSSGMCTHVCFRVCVRVCPSVIFFTGHTCRFYMRTDFSSFFI